MFWKIIAAVFLICSIGGEIGMYKYFQWWDVMLHGAFGFLFTLFIIPRWRIKEEQGAVALWVLGIAAIWEMLEWLADYYLGWNMQKSGLNDTMSDLAVTLAGSLTAALIHRVALDRKRKA